MSASRPTLAGINARNPRALNAAQRSRLAQLMANPATRHLVADKFLSPQQRQQRTLNTRLNAPAAPGSSLTNRDLSRQVQAQTTVKYGPAEQQTTRALQSAQGLARDTSGWYDQYLAELQQHAANSQQIGQQAVDQIAALGGAIRGFDKDQTTGMQQQANQDAAARGATAGDLTQTGSDASTVRQALIAAFGAQQAANSGATNRYADTLAHVVGPTQKLRAQAQAAAGVKQAQDDITALRQREGADALLLRQSTLSDEAKNAIAQQALGLNVAKTAAQIKQNTPGAKAKTAGAVTEAQVAAKHGYSLHDWRMLGPQGRKAKLAADKNKPADSVYTGGAFAGLKKSAVNAMTDQQRQQIIAKYEAKHGGKGKGKDGKPTTGTPGSASPAAQQKAIEQIRQAQRFIADYPQLTSGQLRKGLNQGYLTDANGNKLPLAKIPADFVNAAFDLMPPNKGGRGGLSPANVNTLHHRYGLRLKGVFPILPATTKPLQKLPSANTLFPPLKP